MLYTVVYQVISLSTIQDYVYKIKQSYNKMLKIPIIHLCLTASQLILYCIV